MPPNGQAELVLPNVCHFVNEQVLAGGGGAAEVGFVERGGKMGGAKWGHGNVVKLQQGNEFAVVNADAGTVDAVAVHALCQLDFAFGKGAVAGGGEHGWGFRWPFECRRLLVCSNGAVCREFIKKMIPLCPFFCA